MHHALHPDVCMYIQHVYMCMVEYSLMANLLLSPTALRDPLPPCLIKPVNDKSAAGICTPAQKDCASTSSVLGRNAHCLELRHFLGSWPIDDINYAPSDV